MVVNSLVPAVDRRPKAIRPHNVAGNVPNTPLGKRNRRFFDHSVLYSGQ